MLHVQVGSRRPTVSYSDEEGEAAATEAGSRRTVASQDRKG